MKLIVEGPDGAGKSTLIEKLGLKRLHLKSLRGGVGGTTQEGWGGQDEAPLAYVKQLVAAPEGTAFDRFYLSEMVYGPLLRGAAGITPEEAKLVERVTRARGIATVVCLPPFRRTVSNVMQEGRERPTYQTPTFLREAYVRWCQMATHTGAHQPHERYFTHFNYTTDDTMDAVTMLGIHQDRVIGSLLGRVLVVTDEDQWPLMSMNGASGDINRALWAAGFREDDLTFTNSRHWRSHDRGVRMAITAMTQAIIAVGVEAEHHLRDVGLENGAAGAPLIFTIPHPDTSVAGLNCSLASIARTLITHE